MFFATLEPCPSSLVIMSPMIKIRVFGLDIGNLRPLNGMNRQVKQAMLLVRFTSLFASRAEIKVPIYPIGRVEEAD